MKRFLGVLVLLLCLSGCTGKSDSMDRAVAMRQMLLNAQGCSFKATVTADYGDTLHTFVLQCSFDPAGEMSFEVTAPDTISGITGTVAESSGKLTFDGQALAFDTLADGQIAPVTAPWLLVKTLRSGYLTSCGESGDYLLLTIDDSYADDAVQLSIWLGERDIPAEAEVIWQGRRILTMKIANFEFL